MVSNLLFVALMVVANLGQSKGAAHKPILIVLPDLGQSVLFAYRGPTYTGTCDKGEKRAWGDLEAWPWDDEKKFTCSIEGLTRTFKGKDWIKTTGVEVRSETMGKVGEAFSARYFKVRTAGDPENTRYYTETLKNLRKDFANFVWTETFFGAHYDFRLSPTELAAFKTKLKAFIEKKATGANMKVVNLVGVGYGGLVAVDFLNGMTEAWKLKYVQNYFSLAVPYNGYVGALESIISGDTSTFGGKWFTKKPKDFQSLMETMTSLHHLVPNKNVESQTYLIKVGAKTFLGDKLSTLWAEFKINFVEGSFKARAADVTDPNVPTHCFYTTNPQKLKTPIALNYESASRNSKVTYEYGDGDGVVPTSSASVCKAWPTTKAVRKSKQDSHISYYHSSIVWKHIMAAIKEP